VLHLVLHLACRYPSGIDKVSLAIVAPGSIMNDSHFLVSYPPPKTRCGLSQVVVGSIVLLLAAPALANITGTVLVEGSGIPGTPIEGARVHLQADPSSPVVLTDENGAFDLPVSPSGMVRVTAALPYDASRIDNYTTGGTMTTNGSNITIRLTEIPAADNTGYDPIKAAPPGGCGDCHVEQRDQWLSSAHAAAAVDTWVLDLLSGDGTAGGSNGYVFTDLHPGETGFCATCHSPVAEAKAPGTTLLGDATTAAELEGVTCTACHQLDQFSNNLAAMHLVGDPAGATFRFPDAGAGGAATHEHVWGPLDDVDYPFMRAAFAPVFESSRMCATCHNYSNPTTGAPGQTTYSEWLVSPWSQAGAGFRSCQNCHMPQASEDGPIAVPTVGNAPTRPAEQRHDHGFASASAGGMATALDIETTTEVKNSQLRVVTTVENIGMGHNFPTGVSVRNAFLLVRASMQGQPLQQFSGPVLPFWTSDDVPGEQEGDWAGYPGRGFAKVLSGTIAGQPTQPVVFIEADQVASNTGIAAGTTSMTEIVFDLPPDAAVDDQVDLDVRLIYRRAWRALAVTKGWTTTPTGGAIELPVSIDIRQITLQEEDLYLFADVFESGDLLEWSKALP
jgi:hypothetical protein